MIVARDMGKGEVQEEKKMVHGFQGSQLLAEASGLSQPKQAETVEAGRFLYPNETSPSSGMKKPVVLPSNSLLQSVHL